MAADRYNAIQDLMLLFNERMMYARDQENLNRDLDLADQISLLRETSDTQELLKICQQQGIESDSYSHILVNLDAQSEQSGTAGIEQNRDLATKLAVLLFRELLLPPANHAPHSELLAAGLTYMYPDLTPDASGAIDVPEKPKADTETNDQFFAPKNLEFRLQGYYKPLSRRKKEIRLVCVKAGKRDDDIQCTLMNPISLADIQSELFDPCFPESERQPPYTALSYAAGNLTKTAKIHLNNVEFEIYESLERALRRIRHKEHAVHIWIDQICIDQHDKAEKAWQVSIMRDIYSSAKQTLVFLDVRDEETSGAEFKKFFVMVYDRATGHVINRPPILPQNTSITEIFGQQLDPFSAQSMERSKLVRSLDLETSQWLASILLRAEHLPSLRFLIAMYSVPWWHRSWVYQELIVSRDVILLCGDEEIRWSAFQVFNKHINEAASLLQKSPHHSNVFLSASKTQFGMASVLLRSLTVNQPAIHQLGRVREIFSRFGECNLRWLLSVWRGLKSTDSRDMVYATTGIARSRYRIVPEYTTDSTMTKLFMQVVKRSVLVDGSLDIILDGGESNRHAEWKLPSWVPDFTAPTSRKFPTIAPQSRHPNLDGGKSQAGPSPNAEYVFRAMDDLPAKYQFFSSCTAPPNESVPSSTTGSSMLLRIELVRRWSLQRDDLGIIGNLPRSQSVHDSWFPMVFEKLKAYATAVDDHGGRFPYTHTDGEDLSAAYDQTVHFYPDVEAVASAMEYEKNPPNPMSMTQDQLAERIDAERILMKGREAQRSGNWRFFCIDDLVMGMVPAGTQKDDLICFAGGISVPFVLRSYGGLEAHVSDDDESQTGTDSHFGRYTVVGAAYVHGYMFGRAAEELACKQTRSEWVDLY